MARSSRRTASTTAATAGSDSCKGKAPAKKMKSSQLSKASEGGAKAKKKVEWMKYSKRCSAAGCTNLAKNGGVCMRHGAIVKRKQCSHEGCTNQVKKGGVCMKHGAKAKQCSKEGCTNQALKGGVCMKHGAKVKLCSKEGCTKFAQTGGVCKRHGAKVKQCSYEGCTNQAKNGGVCMKHGAKAKQCSKEGCTNQVKNGGVCMKHGAKAKLCSKEGCTKFAQTGGVCKRHGAKVKQCSYEGCTNKAKKGGVCIRHGARANICSKGGCTNQAIIGGVCWSHGAKLKAKCGKERCSNLARSSGGLCYSHWAKKHRAEESTAEQAEVAVPALPPIDLQPSETECAICFEACNANEMVTCAAESACSCVVCHDCLVTSFSRPLKMVNGQFIEYDPTQCPVCRVVGAFSLNARDAAVVNLEMNEMYCFEAASVGASYASTSHEQSDSEWEMGDE